MPLYLYTSTDSNEIKALVEERITQTESFLRDYDLSQDKFYFGGAVFKITNLPLSDALKIKKSRKLSFVPLSYSECTNRGQKEKLKGLAKKLFNNKVKVAISENGRVV